MWIVHDKQLSLNRSSFSKRLLMLVQWWLLCEKYPPLMRTALVSALMNNEKLTHRNQVIAHLKS